MDAERSASSVTALLLRLWHGLQPRRRRQFKLILGLMVVSAFAEVASLGAVLPFLGILTAPERVFANRWVAHAAHALGIDSARDMLLPLTVAFAARRLAGRRDPHAAAVGQHALHLRGRRGSEHRGVSAHALSAVPVHVARNSSEVISGITNKVGGTVLGVVLPLMTLMSSGMLLVAIPLALIAIDPVVALAASLALGASYGVISWLSRRRLYHNSRRHGRRADGGDEGAAGRPGRHP